MKLVHGLWNMVIGGAERALYQLVREQRRNGLDADVLLASHAGLYGEMTRETGAQVFELLQKGTVDMSVAGRVHEVLANYSLVHFHCAEPSLIHLASREKNLRRVYTHRGCSSRFDLRRLLRYKFTGHYLRRYFHGFSGNTAHACSVASKLYNIPRERFAVTYNGIDFSLLEPKRSRGEVLAELGDNRGDIIRIGTSANLRRLKRIDRLLDAVASIGTERLHLYIMGDGPARAELEARSRSLEIEKAVTFAGKKEGMGDYLQLFDIFSLPSGPEESFGNAAVEAMGMGIPTIVFADGGGLVEHIDNGTTGFIVKDTPELAAVIARLMNDPSLRSNIGAAARAEMRDRYSPSRMVERYSLLYERALVKQVQN
jgi:glycosyltransferase involved in cell wall biosynthesis